MEAQPLGLIINYEKKKKKPIRIREKNRFLKDGDELRKGEIDQDIVKKTNGDAKIDLGKDLS